MAPFFLELGLAVSCCLSRVDNLKLNPFHLSEYVYMVDLNVRLKVAPRVIPRGVNTSTANGFPCGGCLCSTPIPLSEAVSQKVCQHLVWLLVKNRLLQAKLGSGARCGVVFLAEAGRDLRCFQLSHKSLEADFVCRISF